MGKPFTIDFDRKRRLGFDEVIYGASKSTSILLGLLQEYVKRDQDVLITRLQKKKAKVLLKKHKKAFFDKASGIFALKGQPKSDGKKEVGIVSAGSSDIRVANEAYFTLQYLGVGTRIIHDVGVAGLQRLLDRVDELRSYDILIVIAGFEGALPTVVGGLLPQPIVAVPTSVGYGTAKNGETALQAMLTSCANGITVTNIDNGYGAAMAAWRMLNLKKS